MPGMHIERVAPASVRVAVVLHALAFAAHQLLEIFVGCSGCGCLGLIDVYGCVFDERPDPVFGLPRRAELAHQQHTERQFQTAGDVRGDRHSAAGQREHDRPCEILSVQEN